MKYHLKIPKLPQIKHFFKHNARKTQVLAGLGAVALIFIYFAIFYKLPSPYTLKNYNTIPLSTHIYDRNGKLLYDVFKEENRTAININDLPPYVKEATISIEDKDFYRHGGISVVGGIARAVKDMILRRGLQGGSTITQQLVKSALLSPERTVRRKIREIILAIWTEQVFTKDQILELYLNQVPYGGANYGIEAAANAYFNQPANKLKLSQAALLAGLPQAPTLYSPYDNPDLAIRRRNNVLKAMHDQKYIDQATYEKAINDKLQIATLSADIKAPHFVFYVKRKLEEQYGAQVVEEGGLKVTTTLDLDTQQAAEKILREELDKVKNLKVSNGAILVTRPSTGEILSMVGSVDYFATPSGAFNVTTALRQPGSSIKPINYAVGIDRKLVTPASVFLDAPTCFKGGPQSYCPVNYDGKFHGPVQLRFALGNSYNIPAVKMLQMNGVPEFIASASAAGIKTFTDPQNYGLSLTLGGGEVRMTEFAQAYSMFPNRGIPKPVVEILKVQDKTGKVLYEFKDPNYIKDIRQPLKSPNFLGISGKPVISQETAYLISHILLDNNARTAAFGDGSFLVIPGKAVSVKTGTTDDKKDNWTIGYTPNFLTAVWVGNNDNSPMNPYLTSGVTGAAPIWHRTMKYILKNQPDLWPIKPEGVVGMQVCTDTGMPAGKNPDGTANCPTRFEYLIKGTENVQTVTVSKETIPVSRDTGKMTKPDDPSMEMKEKTVMKDKMGAVYCVDCTHDEH